MGDGWVGGMGHGQNFLSVGQARASLAFAPSSCSFSAHMAPLHVNMTTQPPTPPTQIPSPSEEACTCLGQGPHDEGAGDPQLVRELLRALDPGLVRVHPEEDAVVVVCRWTGVSHRWGGMLRRGSLAKGRVGCLHGRSATTKSTGLMVQCATAALPMTTRHDSMNARTARSARARAGPPRGGSGSRWAATRRGGPSPGGGWVD